MAAAAVGDSDLYPIAVLIDELVCAKVERKVLWVHALNGFIGEYATAHACLFTL